MDKTQVVTQEVNYDITIHTVKRVYFEGIIFRGFRGLGMYREHL